MANATVLTFEPGLYAVEFLSAPTSMTDTGLPMPCARIEPLPAPEGPSRALVVTSPAGGWLSRQMASAHVLVTDGNAGALLTIYRFSDSGPVPEVRFSFVLAAPAASSASRANELPPDAIPSAAAWLTGEAGQPLRGFQINPPAGLLSSQLEYQGIMGLDWRTPWVESGEFCGSRTSQLPLLGFRLRLRGPAADRFTCQAWGRFNNHGEVGPIAAGEDCYADGEVLAAMKVILEPITTS